VLERITTSPEILSGKPVIRGMRIPVSLLVKLVASGMSREGILAEYPLLVAEDVDQALEYAAYVVDHMARPRRAAEGEATD
jgi:uncharacterized protein (DUF433 family)